MLFAAGFGARMQHLTKTRPKPLVEVLGRPLIDYARDQVRDFGAERVLCNLHYLPEALEAHLAGSGVLFSHEEPDILDTGGGLKAALPLLRRETVFTMNTDAVWRGPNPLSCLADMWNPQRMDALLLCVQQENAIGHSGAGDFVIESESRAIRGPGVIYTGLQIIKTTSVADVPETVFSLNLVWNRMIAEARLCAVTYPGRWCDVGSPAGVVLAEEFLRNGNV